MINVRKIKNIDSILQITKDVVQKNNNYNDYILRRNNSLFIKQLPLLKKQSRIQSLILSKPKVKNIEKDIIYQSTRNSLQKEEKKDGKIISSRDCISPLNSIRTIKIRSKKLPPLCPLFNNEGLIKSSFISPKQLLYNNILNFSNNDDFPYNLPNSLDISKNSAKILKNQKLKVKKLRYNKSFDFSLNFNRELFNEAEYSDLKYDESIIYGREKFYQEIIRKKLIELKTNYNKNMTIHKEKVYELAHNKKKIYLHFDSLKIRLNEIKDESNYNIEVYEKPSLEYNLPFSLLPLFYYKNVESFLLILTKLIIWNEDKKTFSLTEKDDVVIANILKNCDDYYIPDLDTSCMCSNIDEKEFSENDLNMIDTSGKKVNEGNNLNNTFNDYSLNFNFLDKINKESDNISVYHEKSIKIKLETKKFDIYPVLMRTSQRGTSTFEYFWITPSKSFILTIEVPLITVKIPSNNILVKQYINFELLFFIYHKNFVMWHFYIIKHLMTYKNFRNLIIGLYSIPEKNNTFFYITEPKHRKFIYTFHELTSIITREINSKPKRNSAFDIEENKDNLQGARKIRFKEETNTEQLKRDLNYNNDKNNNNKESTPKFKFRPYFNSTFTQKGLSAVASFINLNKGTCKEYTIHFNVDQLRKFQIVEMFVDKISFFLKFLKINYENESVSFDFETFNAFDEFKWVKDFNKYNYHAAYKSLAEDKSVDNNEKLLEPKIEEEFPGKIEGTRIKIEIKFPLILMKALDESCVITAESVNVDHKVENILRKIVIHNSIDLTRQLVKILKDNNFCRKVYILRRGISRRNRGTKRLQKSNKLLPTKLINNTPRLSFISLGIPIDDKKEN